MARLTRKLPGGEGYVVPDGAAAQSPEGLTGEAVDRLGRFEDLRDDLSAQQDEIAERLEALRAEGKQKTTKFRELLGRKMMNNNFMTMLGLRDLL